MDIIHRRNPFHRPPSSQRGNSPTPSSHSHTLSHHSHVHAQARDTPLIRPRPSSSLEGQEYQTSSIDSAVPRTTSESWYHPQFPHSDAVRSQRYSTPLPPSPSKQRGKHQRTPSILRSLAHHPSLSALKGKSKKKAKRALLDGGEDHELPYATVGRAARSSPQGEGRLRKGSKSIPRDMRLSSDSQANDPLPPVPSTLPNDLNASQSQSQSRTNRERSMSPGTDSIRRKPAPSLDLTQNFDLADESMRVRMRLELDVEPSPRSRAAAAGRGIGLGHASPGRKRYMSFDERFGGMPRDVDFSQRTSPPRPGLLSTPPRIAHPATTQHPHPVPLSYDHHYESYYPNSTVLLPERDRSYGSAGMLQPPMIEYDDEEDDMEEDDGLDMFVQAEEMPVGTPGGKKEDLRRGAFVDGVRHEKDAVRFFSRDMYAPTSGTPSTATHDSLSPPGTGSAAGTTPPRTRQRAESSPSPRRNVAREQFAKAAKRSSSPFEIKLSPFVTKRMSLDAFGTPSPAGSSEEVLEDASDESHISAFGQVDREQAADDVPEDAEGDSEIGGIAFETFQSTALSTIDESPAPSVRTSWDQRSHYDNPPRPTRTPATHERPLTMADQTSYLTPFTGLRPGGLPFPSALSYNLSSSGSPRHFSAPPLGMTNRLLEAHAEHAQALQGQIKASEVVMDVLRSEVQELRASLEAQNMEPDRFVDFAAGKDKEVHELAWRCGSKDRAIEQLHQAIMHNEQVVDDLDKEYDTLQALHEQLKNERDEALSARAEDAAALKAAEEGRIMSEVAAEGLKLLNAQLEEEKADLIEQARNFHTSEEQARSTLSTTQQQLAERETTVNLLRQQIESMSTGYDLKLSCAEEGLRVAHNQLEERDRLLVNLQQEVDALRETKEAEGAQSRKWQDEVEKKQEEIVKLSAEVESLQERLKAKEATLEDQLLVLLKKDEELAARQADFDAQQASFAAQAKSTDAKLEEQEVSLRTLRGQLETVQLLPAADTQALKSTKMENVEKDKIISSMREKLGLMRFENDEKLFAAQEDISRVREELEELTRMGAEREWAALQTSGRLARYEEEKRAWDEEREELVEMIQSRATEEDTAATLLSQLNQVTSDLHTMRQHADHLELDLEDKRSQLRRQTEDSERVQSRLRSQISDLEDELDNRTSALSGAVTIAESLKVSSLDSGSRLERYLTEIDQLKLAEARLKADLEDQRRASAMNEMKLVEVEKKVKRLEEDKELLNVALESKQVELTLLQRREKPLPRPTPTPTPTPAGHGGLITASIRPPSRTSLSASTSGMSRSTSAVRVPPTPTLSTGPDTTPVPAHRRLTSSTSTSTSTSTANNSFATARARRETSAGLGGRAPLGSSTNYNAATPTPTPATATPTMQGRLEKLGKAAGTGTAEGATRSVGRRTSLPVLKRAPSASGQVTHLRKVEEDQ